MYTNNNNSVTALEQNPPLKQKVRSHISRQDADIELMKKGIWLYFFLLVFEGALRKWVLPGLSAPLLIVRDPVAIGLLFLASRRNILVFNHYIVGVGLIGIIGILTALLFGHKNISVALFGVRILLVQFPLIFVIGRVFTYTDVIKMGKVILYISILMALLVAMQFYSPQSAWVNRGVGGDTEGAGFSGANGFYRPPATFSFITGTVSCYTLTAASLIFFW